MTATRAIFGPMRPFNFSSEGGQGHALGANYHSTDGMLQLRHDVHLTLTPADRSAAKHVDTPPMVASLAYRSDRLKP